MGRIRTKYIKRISKKILEDYNEFLSEDFSKNKENMKNIANIYSKKIRNKIAGCITKLKKDAKKEVVTTAE